MPGSTLPGMRSARTALVAALLVITAGCATSTPAPAAAPAAAATAEPTGPSDTAQMVCASEAQEDIAAARGSAPRWAERPTGQARLYTCRYVYAGGSFVMSVKDLKNALETTDYFESLQKKLGDVQNVDGLGQGGF